MRMKRKVRPVVVGMVLGGLLAGGEANAGEQEVTVPVTATINQTIDASATALNFGTIELDPNGDTITINAKGTAGVTATVNKAGDSIVSNSPTNGKVTISSNLSFDILVSYDSSVDLIGGSSTVVVDDIQNKSDGSATIATTHTGGTDTVFYVGGVLNLPGDTPVGDYSGDLKVTLTYQ